MHANCKTCGQPFEQDHPSLLCCSGSCGGPTRACITCGRDLEDGQRCSCKDYHHRNRLMVQMQKRTNDFVHEVMGHRKLTGKQFNYWSHA